MTPAPDADVIVVGGGPVGLGAACVAAARGARVVLVERHSGWPVDKACGEGLMPGAVRWLTEIGVHVGEAAPFVGIRYIDGDRVAAGTFPHGVGLGVRRKVLSAALAARAAASGVDLRPGVTVAGVAQDADAVTLKTSSGPLRARWVIAADGLHSPVRRMLGVPVAEGAVRFGLRRHFACTEVPDHVEVHWGDGAEAYVTPVGPGLVGVAILRGAERQPFDALFARFPAVQALCGAPVDTVRGSGPFAHAVATPREGRVLFVGDASGYLDAITGEGLALGWAGATAAVDAALSGRPERWPVAARVIRRRHVAFTRLLLAIAARPWLRRRVVAALARSPAAFSTLLGFNEGVLGAGAAAPAVATLGLRLLTG